MLMLRCKGLTGCKPRIFICALNAVNVTRGFPRVFLVGTFNKAIPYDEIFLLTIQTRTIL